MGSNSGESDFAQNNLNIATSAGCGEDDICPDYESADHREARDRQGINSIGRELKSLTFTRRWSIPHPPDEEYSERPESLQSAPIPDGTYSDQGSRLSSPSSSIHTSVGAIRPHRPTSLQPFDHRFTSRLSSSPLASPRGHSPVFSSDHSRQSSVSSNITFKQLADGPVNSADTLQPPWEVMRWTKLKKITTQVFSEVGKRNFGRPTCLHVAASLVIGTSKGFILVFDYHQVLKSIIGPGTKAVECGAITALATSADHSTVAGGHATGHVFTWEFAKPAKPFLHVSPLIRNDLDEKVTDGHISGASILHLGFLGTRHTALVSADDAGMAFSHLATRGLGVIARIVKTTRILGRYPPSMMSTEKPRKPSSVLAFAPLPLGNVEQPIDSMGLTALLTPYLLIIVSTTPIAQTQHKSPRPKDVTPHGTLSGCLAWFPSVRLKNQINTDAGLVSKTKLVYCWSNVLTLLEIDATVIPPSQKEKPTELGFQSRRHWKAAEAIVAVQWLGRSVLGVVTISQRLLILDNHLRMTDSFDLLQSHVYHYDLFSRQLNSAVENTDDHSNSMHGVVADAFYMSVRAYKGRLFLLGFNDVSIGTLSNWADRLLSLMEEGDFVAAISLATSYYKGGDEKLTIGLPEDGKERQSIVEEKLISMVTASLKYAFAVDDDSDDDAREQRLTELANVIFTALVGMKKSDFMFGYVFDSFQEASAEKCFFETLRPYILRGEVTTLPPNVLQDLITSLASANQASYLEETICKLNTDTMDINQVTTLCKQYVLYDALIYVWTCAIGDYISPLTNLIELIKLVDHNVDNRDNIYMISAKKIFGYLAYTLTGRTYPGGVSMEDDQASCAKKDIYQFLFSAKSIQWPPGIGATILTLTNGEPEPSYPYLRLMLNFDIASFMSMLNEAFEDNFLNDEPEEMNKEILGDIQARSTLTPTRQYIVNLLFGIMVPENFKSDDIVFFYMFVARNLPKYPQHIMLPGTSIHQVLIGLCNHTMETAKEDCQLSVEYLLSVYHPPDPQTLVPSFKKAGFHRVLQFVYRDAQQYAELLQTYLEDDRDPDAVFVCLVDLLRPRKGLTKKQLSDVQTFIIQQADRLAGIDAARIASILKRYVPNMLQDVAAALAQTPDVYYFYLEALIEPDAPMNTGIARVNKSLPPPLMEQYVQLMCTYNSSHAAQFVGLLDSGDLQLGSVLPALEKSGAVDAAVVLLVRDGLVQDAMARLIQHFNTLSKALTGLIAGASDTPDLISSQEASHNLLEEIHKYTLVGIWLCQRQTQSVARPAQSFVGHGEIQELELTLDEVLWLELVDTVVQLIRETSSATTDLENTNLASQIIGPKTIDTGRVFYSIRSSIQHTFSALLASTTVPSSKLIATHTKNFRSMTAQSCMQLTKSQPHTNPSFLRIFSCFLTRATATYSPSLSHLRSVLSEIFAAYTFEETILGLAHRLLAMESFRDVHEINNRRKFGWRPRGQDCEGCKKRAWGPGSGGVIWEIWNKSEEENLRKKMAKTESGDVVGEKVKGKRPSEPIIPATGQTQKEHVIGKFILFACRHLWHQECLDKSNMLDQEAGHKADQVASLALLRCPLC